MHRPNRAPEWPVQDKLCRIADFRAAPGLAADAVMPRGREHFRVAPRTVMLARTAIDGLAWFLVAPELTGTSAPVRRDRPGVVVASRPHDRSALQRSITGGISGSVKPGRPSGMWSHGSCVFV
jgi:hypothetical protein